MTKIDNTPTKNKPVLTVDVSPDIVGHNEYVGRETRTIYPDRFYSMEAKAVAAEKIRERLGLGPETWSTLTDNDRAQLSELVQEAA